MGCKHVQLSDVATLTPGFAFKSKDFGNYDAKAIKITDVSDDCCSSDLTGVNIDKYSLAKMKKYLVHPGDYFLAMTGSIGKVGRITVGSAYLNQRVLGVRPSAAINKGYLWHLLNSNDFKNHLLTHIDSHSVQANISAKSVGSFEFDLPERAIQDAIASILGSFDSKIQCNTRLNGYLLEMAKVIYRQWFVGDTAKYPTTTMKLSDIATINAGGDKPKDVSQTIQPGFCVPIYSNGTDNEGLYGFTSVAKVNEPSVTVSARGTIGFTCLRRRPYYPIVRLISATPKRCVTAEYLYLWLLNTSVVGVGTTQQQLTVPMFKAYDIKVPEAKAMEQFSQTINPLFDAIDSNKEECIKLAALRDVLLPRLMSGEIDVQRRR